MKAWFLALSRRDQTALLLLGAVLLLWLLYQLALRPAAEARANMEMNNAAASELLTRVDTKVAQLMALRAEGQASPGGNLTTVLSRLSESLGLPVRRLQPNSRGEVQVRFESVDYDQLVRWLHALENEQGLAVVDAAISQAGRSGGVNATIRVAGGR